MFSDDTSLTPMNHITVFEGATGEDLPFHTPYTRESQPWHEELSTAIIQNQSKVAAGDMKDWSNKQIVNPFLEFMNNERQQYQNIQLEVRFGKIYYFGKRKNNDEQVPPRSAFQPLHMSHKAIKTYLEQKGYQLTSTETVFRLSMKENTAVDRVTLDENLEVVQVSRKRKPLTFNIIRMDSN